MPHKRVGRPSKAVLASLRGLVASDYQKLLQAVVMACVEHAGKNNYPVVWLKFHHLTKFADDFPLGRGVVKKDGPFNLYRVKARKLLDWLRKHGHTTLTVDDIGNNAASFSMKYKELFDL
jgi:hypothetical protein